MKTSDIQLGAAHLLIIVAVTILGIFLISFFNYTAENIEQNRSEEIQELKRKVEELDLRLRSLESEGHGVTVLK